MNAFKNFPTVKALTLGLGLLIAHWQPTFAQTPADNRPSAISDSEQTLESAIAPYRDDVRRSVLLASQQPQVLTNLADQQANSQQAFNRLIQFYGQTKQGWFYDIARFPNVLHELATLPAGSDQATVQEITKTLPTDLQEPAWKLYRHHHDDLVQADNLNQQADDAFNKLISPLDEPTQAAFRQLMAMPDVLSLLTQQIDKTTKLGQAFQVDPDGVTQNLTALHDSLDAQTQRELADYQRELDQDPQARQELQQAGQAYAQANGYKTGINPNPAWVNTSYYYQNPYSFWFGYPYWYASPIWYPSAWWYGTGFYYGLGGNMVLFGLPSVGFSNWFFNRGYGYYPHLYRRFNTYYVNNIGVHRIWAPGSYGFMGAARRAFGPVNGSFGNRSNWLTNPQYARPNTWSGSGARGAAPMYHTPNMNSGGFRTQSWGGFSGRSFGGFSGSHSFGGGFHGGRR